jgi:energy-coupling factor transport system ATP-binding protein
LLKGLIKPTSGQIDLQESGKPRSLATSDLLDLVGWTDAQPERQIFASSVEEEIGFALANRGISGKALHSAVCDAMLKVALDPDRFLARDPLTLSGGEKRRVALASTIVVPSPFLIFDEPEAGLDDSGTAMIANLIDQLRRTEIGIMIISHDPASIWQSADRIITMAHGKLTGEFNQETVDWQKVTDWLESGTKESIIP